MYLQRCLKNCSVFLRKKVKISGTLCLISNFSHWLDCFNTFFVFFLPRKNHHYKMRGGIKLLIKIRPFILCNFWSPTHPTWPLIVYWKCNFSSVNHHIKTWTSRIPNKPWIHQANVTNICVLQTISGLKF